MKKKTQNSLETPKSDKLSNDNTAKVGKDGALKKKKRTIEEQPNNNSKKIKTDDAAPSDYTLKKKKKNDTSKISINLEEKDWPEIRRQQKIMKNRRKLKRLKDVYEATIEAKKIGEKLRRTDCKSTEREELTMKIHSLLEGQYAKVIFSHDMSRIIQWLLKYSTMDIRKSIFDEMRPSLLMMLQSKYAKNCIKNILKYGNDEMKRGMISACYRNVVKLTCHTVSAPLIELMYSNWANNIEKIHFKQEFYGDMYKSSKDDQIKCLSDVFKTATDMKSATLTAVKGNLTKILNKEFINSTLVQTVLSEFLTNCSPADRSELIISLRASIVPLSETKNGTNVATMCVWHGTSKDRKMMMKSLKDNVKTIAMSEHGYLVLLALFDSIDDTVLMEKIVLSEMKKDLTEIALNEHGKHTILYMVARRDPCYFPPSLVEYLKRGDGNSNSKKSSDIRGKEVLEGITDSLLDAIVKETSTWLCNGSISMVTLAILKAGKGEKLKSAFTKVAEFLTDPKSMITSDEKEIKPIEHPGLHLTLKKLIQHDKKLIEENETTFGNILVDILTNKILEEWIQCNRGCFLIINLLENESKSTVDLLTPKLKSLEKKIKTQNSPGSRLLLQKLQVFV